MSDIISEISRISEDELRMQIALIDNVNISNAVKETGYRLVNVLADVANSFTQSIGIKNSIDYEVKKVSDLVREDCLRYKALDREKLEKMLYERLEVMCPEIEGDMKDKEVKEQMSRYIIDEAASAYGINKYMSPAHKIEEISIRYNNAFLNNIMNQIRNLTAVQKKSYAEQVGRKGSIKPFDFAVNKGEVVGLTGLLGSGRSELVRAIYGADKPDTGKIKVNGKEVKINSPLDAMKQGMAYLPEDRKKDGILADLSVRENIIIALQAKRGMFHPMSRKEMEEAADKYIDMLQIKTASRETPIKSLSGGNQQKVIIGRWLLTNPDYLILDEPTRGIDIGTKTEIQKLVLDLADQGMAVTFISSEVEEMLRTCSRMGVLRDGKKVGEISGDQLTQEGVMKAIAGGDSNE